MSFSKFSKFIYKSFTTQKQCYKFFYITFKGPNVNEIISYFENLQNKILDLKMCKKISLFPN
jgi:hypothetical protein